MGGKHKHNRPHVESGKNQSATPSTKTSPRKDEKKAENTSQTAKDLKNDLPHDAKQMLKEPRAAYLSLSLEIFGSILFRISVFLFLRVIPGRFGFYSLYFYAMYLVGWVIYESTLAVRRTKTTLPNWKKLFAALVTGQSTKNHRVNAAMLGIHTLLLLLFLDSYFSPYMFPSYREAHLRFARMGALGPTSAKLHVRYPHALPALDGLWENDIEGDVLQDAGKIEEPVRVVWRTVPEMESSSADPARAIGSVLRGARRWERGPVLHLSEDNDWTATATLEDLWPATKYEWRLAFVHNNTFAPLPERPISFVTWPDPRLSAYLKTTPKLDDTNDVPLDDPNHFKFAAMSCVKPDFPYHPAQFWGWNWLLKAVGIGNQEGGIAQRNRIRGFDLMADRLVKGSRAGVRFLLEVGDLIYADVPRYEGPGIAAYRKLYRNLFASSSFQRIFASIPIFGIYDDHEIVNNWSGGGYGHEDANADEQVAKAYADHPSPPPGLPGGIQAWNEYVGRANPSSVHPGEHYYTFQYGDSAFFVMDTRKHRVHPSYPGDGRTTLGMKQRAALLSWLTEVNQTTTFKFLVSSVPFTSLWGGPLDFDGRKDGWSAYPEERQQLLDIIQYVPNVIILSGDRHEFASVSMRNSVVEFSTSPLSMFYIPIRTLSQDYSIDPEGEEVLLKYLPDGNHKWTELEVDTRDPSEPALHATVVIDGKEAWKVTVLGQPVHRPQGALGSLAKSLMELLGFRNLRWFD
ncbi:alkaline phosphatase [Malassezia psittaci]|uniref:Alkaline phosphatase n=1 Tax=Malassezia psittaci TaxID=1821823 RepID=A0AAF0F8U9_9BASI|nr:alkaline phosphatase [Malassezia psittaci]